MINDIQGIMLFKYENKSELNFNVGIPITHPAFLELISTSENLKNIVGDYATVGEFVQALLIDKT